MSEHSPLPWSLFGDGTEPAPGIEAADDTSVVVWGEGGHDDAGVQGETPEQAKANALFIVKAVNAHNDLVAALEFMMRQHGGLGCSPAYKQAEAILTKVKP